MRAKKVAGYPNYDSSEFEVAGTLEDHDDAQLESIWKREFELQSIVAPSEFKSYEALQERLNAVLNLKRQDREPAPEAAPSNPFATKPPTAPAPEAKAEDDGASQSSMAEEDDDVLDYFQKLADS